MDITFEFHHDGDGPPDEIQMLGVDDNQRKLLQDVVDGNHPDNEGLMLTCWVGGRYCGRRLFRVSRIRNVQFH